MNSYIDEIISFLLSQPYAKFTVNKRELTMRCPFCGDSVKHANSTHLYIKVDISDNEPFVYYCQRCKSKGIIDKEFFKALKCRDTNLIISNIEYNKKATKNKKRYSNGLYKTNLKYPTSIQDTKLNRAKLNYINSRIGTSLSYEDLEDYKIILNLYDVLDENKVDFTTCSEDTADKIDRNFIGFISFDNNYIIMRNLSKTIMKDRRYYNYNIFDYYENSKKFYVIPTVLDTLNPNVTIILAEGVFDILSVYFNIKNKEKDNIIYAAVGGVGYSDTIKQIVRYTGALNFNLEIYGDNDQNDYFYKSLLKNNSYFLPRRYTLYRNSLEKDFGVPKDRISLSKTIIT